MCLTRNFSTIYDILLWAILQGWHRWHKAAAYYQQEYHFFVFLSL